jgi:hypothetical protein
MRRRAFIAALGGAAARALRPNRVARIGVLMSFSRAIRKERPGSWPFICDGAATTPQ